MNKFDQVILLTVFRERINILILWISIGCIDCRQRAGRKHEQRERFGINGKIEQWTNGKCIVVDMWRFIIFNVRGGEHRWNDSRIGSEEVESCQWQVFVDLKLYEILSNLDHDYFFLTNQMNDSSMRENWSCAWVPYAALANVLDAIRWPSVKPFNKKILSPQSCAKNKWKCTRDRCLSNCRWTYCSNRMGCVRRMIVFRMCTHKNHHCRRHQACKMWPHRWWMNRPRLPRQFIVRKVCTVIPAGPKQDHRNSRRNWITSVSVRSVARRIWAHCGAGTKVHHALVTMTTTKELCQPWGSEWFLGYFVCVVLSLPMSTSCLFFSLQSQESKLCVVCYGLTSLAFYFRR